VLGGTGLRDVGRHIVHVVAVGGDVAAKIPLEAALIARAVRAGDVVADDYPVATPVRAGNRAMHRFHGDSTHHPPVSLAMKGAAADTIARRGRIAHTPRRAGIGEECIRRPTGPRWRLSEPQLRIVVVERRLRDAV